LGKREKDEIFRKKSKHYFNLTFLRKNQDNLFEVLSSSLLEKLNIGSVIDA
jgi:hypothetical protein